MKRFSTIAVAAGALVLSGCFYPRPGVNHTASPGLGQTLATVAGATGGAAAGYAIDGKEGALIGAAAGGTIAAVATSVAATSRNNAVDEAREQGARDERVKIMNDYWTSEAINKSHVQGTDASTKKDSVKMVYPPGVYDGVLYGPRTVEVPAPVSK